MHAEAMRFLRSVKERFPEHFTRCSVLEVGSLNINGTVRGLFDLSKRYVGLDLGPGPGVDHVCRGNEYDDAERFDTVISSEAFEHDINWPGTFFNMVRLARPGGLIVVTCATYDRKEHGTTSHEPGCSPFTNDYYANVGPEEFTTAASYSRTTRGNFSAYAIEIDNVAHDLYFWGVKK